MWRLRKFQPLFLRQSLILTWTLPIQLDWLTVSTRGLPVSDSPVLGAKHISPQLAFCGFRVLVLHSEHFTDQGNTITIALLELSWSCFGWYWWGAFVIFYLPFHFHSLLCSVKWGPASHPCHTPFGKAPEGSVRSQVTLAATRSRCCPSLQHGEAPSVCAQLKADSQHKPVILNPTFQIRKSVLSRGT